MAGLLVIHWVMKVAAGGAAVLPLDKDGTGREDYKLSGAVDGLEVPDTGAPPDT